MKKRSFYLDKTNTYISVAVLAICALLVFGIMVTATIQNLLKHGGLIDWIYLGITLALGILSLALFRMTVLDALLVYKKLPKLEISEEGLTHNTGSQTVFVPWAELEQAYIETVYARRSSGPRYGLNYKGRNSGKQGVNLNDIYLSKAAAVRLFQEYGSFVLKEKKQPKTDFITVAIIVAFVVLWMLLFSR